MTVLHIYCLVRQSFTEYYFRKIAFQMFQVNKAWVLKEGSLQYPEYTDTKKDSYSPQVLSGHSHTCSLRISVWPWPKSLIK